MNILEQVFRLCQTSINTVAMHDELAQDVDKFQVSLGILRKDICIHDQKAPADRTRALPVMSKMQSAFPKLCEVLLVMLDTKRNPYAPTRFSSAPQIYKNQEWQCRQLVSSMTTAAQWLAS